MIQCHEIITKSRSNCEEALLPPAPKKVTQFDVSFPLILCGAQHHMILVEWCLSTTGFAANAASICTRIFIYLFI